MTPLTDIWNWLPTFRAVAETEHLPTASKRLHVTPAAISRTIGLLEDRLGTPLFNRKGKRLSLNGDGRALLASVQEAMTAVQGGLHNLDDQPLSGPVRISTIGLLTQHYVLPAILELCNAHPDLRPELRIMGTRDAAEALLSGEVDVAFIYESMTLEGLQVERLGTTTASIYCGGTHPLFDREKPGLDELLEFPFSVPQIGDTGRVQDGWPAEIPRQVGMRITLLTTNLAICRSGQFLTVLPDVTALPYTESGQLRRFRFDLVAPISLFVAIRSADGGRARARGVVDAVRRRADQLQQRIQRFRQSSDGEDFDGELR